MKNTTEEMRVELVRLFARFDSDANGLIDVSEFRKILAALGEDFSDAGLAEQFAIVDKDGDGSVRYEEFAEWWIAYK